MAGVSQGFDGTDLGVDIKIMGGGDRDTAELLGFFEKLTTEAGLVDEIFAGKIEEVFD